MNEPTEGSLRAASAGLQVAALASLIPFVSEALRHAANRQTYLVEAQALGMNPEEAQRVLQDVLDELAATGTLGADPIAIAHKRMLEGLNGIARPPEEVREAVRQLLGVGGYSPHPDVVDDWARRLQDPGLAP